MNDALSHLSAFAANHALQPRQRLPGARLAGRGVLPAAPPTYPGTTPVSGPAAPGSCPNEGKTNSVKRTCFEPHAVVTPSARVTTAPITATEFIAMAAFFTLATLGALGGFAA